MDTIVRTIRVSAEKRNEPDITAVCTVREAEALEADLKKRGYEVKVQAPRCPLASGFRCYEGCASACLLHVNDDRSAATYSCGVTQQAVSL